MRKHLHALFEEHDKQQDLSAQLNDLTAELTHGQGEDNSINTEELPESEPELEITKQDSEKETEKNNESSISTNFADRRNEPQEAHQRDKKDGKDVSLDDLAKATGETKDDKTGKGKVGIKTKLREGMNLASGLLKNLKKGKGGGNGEGGPKFKFDFNEFKAKYLTKAYAKEFAHDKSRMALAIACVACGVSFYNSCSSPTSYLDSRNPFIRSNMAVNHGGGFASSTSQKSDANALPNQPNNQVALDPALQKQDGMVIKDKNEFKRLVQESLTALRSERNRQLMNERAVRFNLAEEAVPAGRKLYGNPKARFIIAEYSDVECPYCKNFWKVPKEVVELSGGQVAVEWKNLPLPFHEPAATQAAVAAQCVYKLAGNKKFWLALDRLFDATQSNGRGSGMVIHELYDELDLNADRYLTCLNEPDSVQAVMADKEDAEQYQIQSTPTSVILDTVTGKTKVVAGAVPKEELMAAIEALNEESQTAGK